MPDWTQQIASSLADIDEDVAVKVETVEPDPFQATLEEFVGELDAVPGMTVFLSREVSAKSIRYVIIAGPETRRDRASLLFTFVQTQEGFFWEGRRQTPEQLKKELVEVATSAGFRDAVAELIAITRTPVRAWLKRGMRYVSSGEDVMVEIPPELQRTIAERAEAGDDGWVGLEVRELPPVGGGHGFREQAAHTYQLIESGGYLIGNLAYDGRSGALLRFRGRVTPVSEL
ncbi:MAG: hypothetical protein H6739_27720 [Alphaproteobacteria bacterium]|nr:hypothetical protein [Alphaproteobacteria bacterium]